GGHLDNAAGAIEAGADLRLAAARLGNAGGTIHSAGGDLRIDAAVLDGAGGVISGQGTLHLQGTHTDLGGGTTVAERIVLDTGTLVTAGGTLASTGTQAMDLTARTGLDNRGGRIASGGGLGIDAGAVDNAGGQIDAQGTLAVSASSFDNRDGRLQQEGGAGLTLSVAGALDNTGGGLIGTTGTATVQAGALDNRGGLLVSRQALALTTAGALDNRDGGLLQGDAGLALQAGGLFDNRGGTLDTRGAATVEAGSIANAGGQLLAGSQADPDSDDTPTLVVVASGDLDNRGGTIGSRAGDVQVSAATLDNGADGLLATPRDLVLDVGVLSNGGTVYADRDLRYETAAGVLDNTGRFGAGENAWIGVASIRNGLDALLQARTVDLVAGTLDLAGGQVAAQTLRMNLGTLSGTGRLYGAQWLDLDIAGDLTYGTGQFLESDGVLELTVGGTLTNLGTMQSTTALLLNAGSLVNQGVINASNADGSGLLDVHAGSVDNRAGARLEGDTVLIEAASVSNTGNIIGNRLLIEAGTLTNGRDLGTADAARAYGEGFIGAAEYLDLRVGRLSNLDAELYSGGDLVVAGRTAGTRATRVDNVSGRIQAEGGLHVGAGTIDTRRRVVEYVNRELTPEEQAAGRREVPAAEHAFYEVVYQREHDIRCSADFDCQLTFSNYRETLTPLNEVAITRASAAAQLLSGGGMTLDTGTLYNRASAIAAGGSLFINGSTAGEDAPGVFNESFAALQAWDVHASYGYQYRQCTRTLLECAFDNVYPTVGGSGSYAPGLAQRPYAPEEGRATITAGGGLSIVSGGDVGNTVVIASGGPDAVDAVAVDPASGPVDFDGPGTVPGGGGVPGPTPVGPVPFQAEAVGTIASPGAVRTALLHGLALDPLQAGWVTPAPGPDVAHVPSDATPAPVPVPGPGPAIDPTVGTPEHPLPGWVPPDNGMYARTPGEGAAFLVNTAPRFARGEQGGSDYLLDALGYDPADPHKRLGDGYYERRLVQEQVQQLTGYRTLAGVADDGDGLAQYTALMDGAAAVAGRLGLSLGAPLTSTQVAALEQDIVWLVEQEVAGERVLVPVVYLSRTTSERLGSSGGLIASGERLNVQAAGAVRNDGTLQGGQSTWLGADTLINDGTVRSARVTVTTAGDVLNRGQLSGGTVMVQAGGDYVQGSDGRLHATQDAGIQADGRIALDATEVSAGRNVVLIAGQDLGVSASRVQAGGDLTLAAGGDLDLVQRSTVTADGAMVLRADRDLSVREVTVVAGQDLTAYAGHDLTVQSGVNDPTSRIATVREGKTRVTTTVTTQTLDVQALTAGGNLALGAGHDVNLVAAELNAGGALTVSAGNDLNTTTLTTADSSHTLETRKRFRQTTTTRDETVHGTTFNAGGDIGLVAGRDVNLAAATAISDQGGVAIAAGRDVNLTSVGETHAVDQTTVTQKKKLLSTKT
ncbi:beta strand repeat-containing protein, partial [Pseudoxanthomonas broegbernensis]|uniref:beta strand repeat-containing protein n=1 Tax=Pseudoxanthomonas broegbernensis TaxID=83619 RepID=UPI001610D091